jgi:hypothetical protein
MESLAQRYRTAFVDEIGPVKPVGDLPVPWFAHKRCPYNLQWAGYVGKCQGENALAFGFNIEHKIAWDNVRDRLTVHALEDALSDIGNEEWHWQGKPAFPCRVPPQPVDLPLHGFLVSQVRLDQWLDELDVIRRGRQWQGPPRAGLMRPRLAIMRRVGDASMAQDMGDVRINLRAARNDMRPLMRLFSGGRYD